MTKKVVSARTGLASTHTRDVYYGYDARGQQLYARFDGASSSSEGLTTVYDALGRMTSSALKMDGVTRTLSYAWDRDGTRTDRKSAVSGKGVSLPVNIGGLLDTK